MVKLALLFLSTPLFVWTMFHPQIALQEISRIPSYVSSHIVNIAKSEDFSGKINDMRAAGGSRFFYNKGLIVMDEFFIFSSYLSPRIYFQAGDGTGLSPRSTEPIAGIMFVFFLFGIFIMLKRRQCKTLAALLIFALLAYATGQPKFPFILPIAVIYTFIGYKAFLEITKKQKTALLFVMIINIFLSIRMFII
jgi:hypothetical protein